MTGLLARKLLWFASALLALAGVRLGLSLLGYKRLKKALGCGKSGGPPLGKAVADRCAWAVATAAPLVPHASCLTQALAGRWLLERRGFDTRVVLGVRRTPAGGLAAHAWLRAGQLVILGGDSDDLSTFTELTELGSAA